MPIPDLKEQKDIVEIIGRVDQKMHSCESRKSVLQDLFKTTLNKLMTGELRIAKLDLDVKEVER